MEKDGPPWDVNSGMLEEQMQDMSLGDSAAPAETPESVRFRSLPQVMQRRLMLEYPRILATAMHRYSGGEDCEAILMWQFESSSEMLRVRNTQGDNPMAAALLSSQDERAEKLMKLAANRNPAALDDRSQYRETLLMLSTASSSAANLMEQLLQRDPTQLHRLYDDDGRNFLHHCTLEESIDALETALKLTQKLIQDCRLTTWQVSAAIHMNDRSGDTPMHMMAARNRRDMLSLLVQFSGEAGIDIKVDERQHRGSRWTPLMTAVTAGAVEAAEFLLGCGADPTEEDTEGRTAVSMAAGNARMMQLFEGVEPRTMEVMEGAAAAAAAATATAATAPAETDGTEEAWMTQGRPVPTVDSGMGTCGDPHAFSVPAADFAAAAAGDSSAGLSAEEIQRVEGGLRSVGKEAAFLGAFMAGHADLVTLAQLSDRPVASLVSQLAYDPGCRRLVRDVLRDVGEPQLGSGL